MSARSTAYATDWQIATLGTLADFVNGYPFKPRDWTTLGLPIVRIAQMTDESATSDYYPHPLPAEYRIDTGDLLYSWSATLLAMIWKRGPAYLNQHIYKVIARNGTRLEFLHHLLNHLVESLASQSHGTTMQHITRGDLLPFSVTVPSPTEQSRIARVLDTVDEAIATTNRVIAKLKQVRVGLLHDLLTRGLDDNGQVRDPVARPEQFQDSPLGRLPRDWGTEKLGRLTTQIVDGVHHTPRYVERGVPFLTAENLTRGPGISIDPCRFVTEEAHVQYKLRADVRAGHVLVSKDGTLGVARVVPDGLPDFSIFVSVALLCPKGDVIAPWLIAEFFETWWFFRQLGYLSAGTGLKHIHLEHFREFLLPVPPIQEQAGIGRAISVFDTLLAAEIRKLNKLVDVKSGLTADLLTGRVRVPESLLTSESHA